MNNKRLTLIVAFVLLLCWLPSMVYAGLLWDAPSGGTIVDENLEVWEDAAGTVQCLEVDWDYPRPGDNVTRILYVQNLGNFPSNITLWTSNWSSPEADQYLILNWNYTGAFIEVFEIIPVELKLIVSPDITGVTDFDFNIGISIEAIIPPD